MNFSLGHKNTAASTQQLLLYSAKQANRHLLFRVQVDAKSSRTRLRKNISSGQRARFAAPFEKSAAHHDWIQLHVLNDTRTTGRATYTRKRFVASIVELYIDSALREIHDAWKAACSASSNSDGGLADRVLKDTSPDLKSNPWFTQYDPSESRCTGQSDLWLDDVKTFYHPPIRCAIVVHPYNPAQRDTHLLAESAHFSCAKICIDVSRVFAGHTQRHSRDVEKKTEE